MVVPLYRPPGVTLLEEVYFCDGWGGVHCNPVNEVDGADYGVGFPGYSHVEDVVDVLGGVPRAWGVMSGLSQGRRGVVP